MLRSRRRWRIAPIGHIRTRFLWKRWRQLAVELHEKRVSAAQLYKHLTAERHVTGKHKPFAVAAELAGSDLHEEVVGDRPR